MQDVTLQQSPQPHLVLWLLPAKKAPGQTQKVPVPLPEASGDVVGAFAGIVRMLRARQAAAGWYGPVFDETGAVAGLAPDAPLFARARTGAPMTKADIEQLEHEVLTVEHEPEESAEPLPTLCTQI